MNTFTEETPEKKTEKEDKWFAVEIKYSAKTKTKLRKKLTENGVKKPPVIIHGQVKPAKVEKNPTLVF